MADVRLEEFWAAAKVRLDTPRMEEILYLPDMVFRSTDDFFNRKGPENQPWGRLILVPVLAAAPPIFVEGETRKEGFLVRAEFNDYVDAGYEVNEDLEAAQEEIYNLLEGWTPIFTKAKVVFNVYRKYYAQPIPLRDDLTGMWYTSSEYQFEAATIGVQYGAVN